MDEMAHRLLELVTGDRAFLESAHHAIAQFVFVKRLSSVVILDQPGHDEFGGFEGREALVACQALPAPANLPALTRESRVYDLGFIVGTIGRYDQP
jgi:hypothetical protein